MNNDKKQETIADRQRKQREKFIQSLEKYPIIKVACDQSGTSRATYYRWREEDPAFRDRADQAVINGEDFLNDMAEHQLIALMKDKHWSAIHYWLDKRHPKFNKTRLEVDGRVGVDFNFEQPQ